MNKKQQSILNMSPEKFARMEGLNTRAQNCFKFYKMSKSDATIRDVLMEGRRTLLGYKNFGLKSVSDFEGKIREHGLDWGYN